MYLFQSFNQHFPSLVRAPQNSNWMMEMFGDVHVVFPLVDGLPGSVLCSKIINYLSGDDE